MKKMRGAEEWKALIAERGETGKTVRQFCKEKGIHPSLYYRKQKELRKAGRFVQVTPPKKPAAPIIIQVKDMTVEAGYGCNREHLVEVLRGVLEAVDA